MAGPASARPQGIEVALAPMGAEAVQVPSKRFGLSFWLLERG
ncbi:hypothetical protein HNP98_000084 [Hymenobacter sp. 9A]|uniref:Uncharacterized protein n=1 Tax=Hymenobacter caeli TaxID=2735894 RepID=A0ABX2FJJ0_9BACT|nr:hypothetical protein [Hymenobacter caeli]